MRTPIIIGNWKLNNTIAEGLALATEIKNRVAATRHVDVAIAPVFTSIAPIAQRLADSLVSVAGQNCYWESSGAWTGEVSPQLLHDAGARYCIVGHSERRQHYGDTNVDVGRKAFAVIDATLTAVICVGETHAERTNNQTNDIIQKQIDGAFSAISSQQLTHVVVAYEPIWAIGTGNTATPDQAQTTIAIIRTILSKRYGSHQADTLRIQYGGSVSPKNALDILSKPDIDGALVGGASLKADSFVEIVKAAALTVAATPMVR